LPITLESPCAEADETAVIYLRVSSPGQLTGHNPEGYSIEGQRLACVRYAEQLGATVVRQYVEPGKSATNLRRPQLQIMLADLPELRPTYVIFYDLSRVARDEFDAFWLLREIKNNGAKLESTMERIDDSDDGMLLYTIATGINAHRSRRDGKKVKMGLERKFAEGGTHGLARIGYLNTRTDVNGREVASIALDNERAPYVKLAFDLAKTGDHTVSSITELLEDAGLRSRATPKRPSRPLSRSMVHRLLREDYYTGVVTRDGVKQDGLHPPIIDRQTFEQVQQVLDAHRLSGDRSQKHHHYLKGTIFCACGKRLGYGRHRGKCGSVYEYFSCLSRTQRGERCSAPYFPVERTEREIVRRYAREYLTPEQQDDVREQLRTHVQAKSEVARRESERHKRRLRELTAQQQKLVQLYYDGGVSTEVLQAEQQRIEEERAKAEQWADAAKREVEDVMQALDDALALLDKRQILYAALNPTCRRLVNQAVFVRIVIVDPDTVVTERTPAFEAIALLSEPCQTTSRRPSNGRQRTDKARISPEDDHDPEIRGRGSYVQRMAERAGFEPAMEFDPHTRLAGECLQPLGHLSRLGTAEFRGCRTARARALRSFGPCARRRADLPEPLGAVVSLRAVVPGGVAELVECDGLENR
jgi:site-specific DNA recombinase